MPFFFFQLKAAEGAQYSTDQAIKLEMELVEMKAERTVMSLRVKTIQHTVKLPSSFRCNTGEFRGGERVGNIVFSREVQIENKVTQFRVCFRLKVKTFPLLALKGVSVVVLVFLHASLFHWLKQLPPHC